MLEIIHDYIELTQSNCFSSSCRVDKMSKILENLYLGGVESVKDAVNLGVENILTVDTQLPFSSDNMVLYKQILPIFELPFLRTSFTSTSLMKNLQIY